MAHLPGPVSPVRTILRLGRTLLFWQLALLAVVAFLWWLTDWHSNSSYGSALVTAGALLVGFGILSIVGMDGAAHMREIEAEAEMLNWDRRWLPRLGILAEPWHLSICIMGIGFMTALIGLLLDTNGVFR